MTANSVITVIVTFNRKELLRESLLCHKELDCIYEKILIIDNASTDGTREYIADIVDNDKFFYVNTGSNLGGAGGFNYGVKKAYEMGCDYIWLMDDDCMVQNGSLENLLLTSEKLKNEFGFLASKVLWKDGSICQMNIPRYTITKNVSDFSTETVPVVMSSFVSLFLKSETVKEFGLPIKEFFIWTDDWEFTRRISRKQPCYLVNNSVVVHKSKSNVGAKIYDDSVDRIERFSYLYRNDIYLYRREGIKGWSYIVVRIMYHILRVLLSSGKDKLARIKIIIAASIRGLFFNPRIENV